MTALTTVPQPAVRQPPVGRALAVVLSLLTVFGPISMDLYLPVLPALTADLGAATSSAQLTVTTCLFGLALGQLIAGRLSDRFGRRRLLLIGVVAYVATSVLCAASPTVEALVAARFVQGLAGGVGTVIAQAAGRDLYSGGRLLRYYGRLTVLAGLAAIVGPVIGGQLASVTDWRGILGFLAAIGALILVACLLVFRETLPAELRVTGGLSETGRDVRRLLADRRFVGAVLISGFVSVALFAYLFGATFLLQEVYGLSPQGYSYAFGLNSLGFMVFGFVAGRASERWSEKGTLLAGLAMVAAGAGGLLATAFLHLSLIAVVLSLVTMVSGVAVTTHAHQVDRPRPLPRHRGHGVLVPGRRAIRVRRPGRPLGGARRIQRRPPGRGHRGRCRAGRGRLRRRHLSPDLRFLTARTIRSREEHPVRGAVLHAPGDVRVEDRPDPTIEQPTDAIIRLAAACVCGSDLWPYRGIEEVNGPSPMGHEYVGVVEEVGTEVKNVKPGEFVVGSFFASDNTCEICQAGYQTHCVQRQAAAATGAQAEYARITLADGTLVATPDMPSDDLVPGLLAASDVLGTGWFAAVAAEAGPGKTVAVVGDGAVGLLGVLAAQQLGAERIIAMSRHEARQKLALEFGATDIVTERGDDGVAHVKELTGGLGAHSVIEAVGTQESMMQAIRATRAGGHVGYVGVTHDVAIPGEELFFSGVHLHGGPAPVRRFLPDLIELITSGQIDPGNVFDLELPLDQAAEGYRAMDERRAIKVLLRP